MTRIVQTGEAIQRREPKLTTVIPVRIRRHGGRKVVIPAAATPEAEAPEHHEPILNALARAYHWQRLLDEGRMTSGVEIARQEGLNQSSVNELLRLTLLSPEVVLALLAGRQPKTLTLRWLKNHEFPVEWAAQREVFGAFDQDACGTAWTASGQPSGSVAAGAGAGAGVQSWSAAAGGSSSPASHSAIC